MTIHTRDFGEVEIDEREIIQFKGPIYGFEQYTQYVFLYDQELSEHFIWLQSVEEAELCFILIDPSLIVDEYCPEIPRDIQRSLGDGDCMCWLMVGIGAELSKSTVNLKSPIVVNAERKWAAQVILEEDLPLRYPLVRREGGAG